jgi:hypothetical protein
MIELLFLKYSSMHRILLVSTWLRRNSIGPVNTSFTGKSVSAEDFSSCFFIDLRILFSTLGSISWRHQRFSSSCYKMSFCQQKWSRAVVRRGISAFFFNRGTKKENLAWYSYKRWYLVKHKSTRPRNIDYTYLEHEIISRRILSLAKQEIYTSICLHLLIELENIIFLLIVWYFCRIDNVNLPSPADKLVTNLQSIWDTIY